MNPAIIANHNVRFTAPPGRPDVVTLFVRSEVVGGIQMLRSAWSVEQAEAGLLLAGAKVLLGIGAEVHPVVNLTVADLPEDFEPVITARRYHCADRGMVARVEGVFPCPPFGLKVWAERPIEEGKFSAAFAEAMEGVETMARETGIKL